MVPERNRRKKVIYVFLLIQGTYRSQQLNSSLSVVMMRIYAKKQSASLVMYMRRQNREKSMPEKSNRCACLLPQGTHLSSDC
jgi:hypothetical protein